MPHYLWWFPNVSGFLQGVCLSHDITVLVQTHLQCTTYTVVCSLVARPRPLTEEKGPVTIERVLGCTESAVLVFGKPMRSSVKCQLTLCNYS